ncbi:alpha/beta hydrolase [Streptomyces sp. SID9727]|uniref:alpha/beta hydrolase n=1 Tax=Streptomyces sp. SID9727 TaxID=2706114 RepID=UPI0013C90369|nr:alpha/beta hydrolase [Streptomyces sp. SID9727]NEC68843.1 alpha/beta hydrolase [Streptomyces sp. SID9727]
MNTKNAHERIDPELAEVLKQVPMTEAGVFDLSDLEGTRVGVRAFAEAIAAQIPDEPSVSVEEVQAPRSDGSTLAIRLLRPTEAAGPLPVLLWFHGGGQVLGYAAQDDPTLKHLVLEVGCIVASVDYRLAPEAPAPAAAEDGLLAYRWVRSRAAALGMDTGRVALAGQSGGGGIAAATALLIRDQGGPAPLFQALSYPMLDDRNTTASSHEVTDIGIWDRATNIRAWNLILGDRAGTDEVPPYCVPARATDLTGLPPTFIAVGELDVFRDEDLGYATRLQASGVPVELHLYPGAFHAFDLFAPATAVSAAYAHAWYGYLRRQFGTRQP